MSYEMVIKILSTKRIFFSKFVYPIFHEVCPPDSISRLPTWYSLSPNPLEVRFLQYPACAQPSYITKSNNILFHLFLSEFAQLSGNLFCEFSLCSLSILSSTFSRLML